MRAVSGQQSAVSTLPEPYLLIADGGQLTACAGRELRRPPRSPFPSPSGNWLCRGQLTADC